MSATIKTNKGRIDWGVVAKTAHPYPLMLQMMPQGAFDNAMRIIINDFKYVEMAQKRNKLVDSLQTTPENLRYDKLRHICLIDDRIAEFILNGLSSYQRKVNTVADKSSMTLDTFKKKYLTTEEARDYYRQYQRALDLASFCIDIADGYITDAVGYIHKIEPDANFTEFDGVLTAMRALQSRTILCSKDVHQEINDLFSEYSDSINSYLTGRFNTFYKRLSELQKDLKERGELK